MKLMFLTCEDNKVCNNPLDPNHSCLKLNRDEFHIDDSEIPNIPRHKNCRCRWILVEDNKK